MEFGCDSNAAEIFQRLVRYFELADWAGIERYEQAGLAVFFEVLQTRFQLTERVVLTGISACFALKFLGYDDLYPAPGLSPIYSGLLGEAGVPLFENETTLGLAVSNPFDARLAALSHKKLELTLVLKQDLFRFFGGENGGVLLSFETLLIDVFRRGASDFHAYQLREQVAFKIRVHGLLQHYSLVDGAQYAHFLSQIKYRAGMDLGQALLPQDGRLSIFDSGQSLDIRVSSLPTVYGEDLVCRFLSDTLGNFDIGGLGFSEDVGQQLQRWATLKSGLILVTGPTGSGKTTTLYAFLRHLLKVSEDVIVTLEDPVEKPVPGVRQSQVNVKAGFSFSTGLRAVLRQDPDVIMIGEIRDTETAKLALEAAYTGHLVVSSLHTPDVYATLARLESLAVDSFLLRQALKGVLCQRLVPKTCEYCQPLMPCVVCFDSGINGRIPVAEMVSFETVPPEVLFHGSWQEILGYAASASSLADVKIKEMVTV